MKTPTTIGRLVLVAALVLSCAWAQAMDLRDLPDWVRDRIWPVEIDWQAMGALGPVPRAPTPAETAASTPVGVAGATGVTTPGGGVTVAAPGVKADGGVHLPGFAGAAPGLATGVTGTGTVHVGAMGGGPETVTVTVSGDTGQADGGLPRAVDTHAANLLHRLDCLAEEGKLDEASFPAWALEHGIDQTSLVGALEALPVDRDTDLSYFPVCGAIWEQSEHSVDTCRDMPPKSRLLMAGYLEARVGAEQAASVVSSFTDAEVHELGEKTLLGKIGLMFFSRAEQSQRTAIWTWKKAADFRGGHYPAWYSAHVRMMCMRLGDPQVVRDELIPWTEAALGIPGSESHWRSALPSLVWAYAFVGEPDKALEVGERWLAEAEKRNIECKYLAGTTRLSMADALIQTGEVQAAADALRELILNGTEWTAEAAQVKLLQLAQGHPEIGNAELLPPKLKFLHPQALDIRGSLRDPHTRRLLVRGNATLRVVEASCDLAFVEVTVGERYYRHSTSECPVEVKIKSPDQPGDYAGTVTVRTNDPEAAVCEAPIRVTAL